MGGNYDQLLYGKLVLYQDRSNTRFLGKLHTLCSAFLQVKQTNKINLELKEKKWGMRSIKKARTYIFTHLFEQIQETKKNSPTWNKKSEFV